MYDNVLIPTNGSDRATRGARHGLRIARVFDSTVHVLGVIDTGRMDSVLDRLKQDHVERIQRDRESAVEAVAKKARGLGLEVVTKVTDGTPHTLLVDYAETEDIDFVAMGTRQPARLERPLLGGVTESMIRTSAAPVLTCREHEQPEVSVEANYDDILIPTRGGDGAELTIEHGIEIAARFDATVHVLYVVDVRSMANIKDEPSIDELLADLKSDVTEPVVDRARKAGLDATATVRQGTPARDIKEYAAEHDIGLIVMGTHAQTRVERLLVGSVAEGTVRTADRPVVTVRMDQWLSAEPLSPE